MSKKGILINISSLSKVDVKKNNLIITYFCREGQSLKLLSLRS